MTIRNRCSTAIVLRDTADALRATLDDAQVVVTLLGDAEEPGVSGVVRALTAARWAALTELEKTADDEQ